MFWQSGKSTAETLDERGHNDDQTSSAEKEMQSRAFRDILEALLEAGYYRVRIANLSEFDKVGDAFYFYFRKCSEQAPLPACVPKSRKRVGLRGFGPLARGLT